MDIAYDHIQEEALSPSSPTSTQPPSLPTASTDTTTSSTESSDTQQPASPTLKSEFAAWGSTFNSWFSQARKQGESFYADLQKEASEAQEQATKGFSSLREQVVQRTRSLSLGGPTEGDVPGQDTVPTGDGAATAGAPAAHDLEKIPSGVSASASAEAEALQGESQPESLPADIVKEAGTLVASLRSTAASRLKDLQKAEDAADEALLKFGTNIRNFLRDAVTITAPDDSKEENKELLFETQEPGTGKKVFHSTRLDAQLHAIHTTTSSFTEDPAQGGEWEAWTREFDIDSKTEDVARDLEKYEELRRAMEKLVPQRVEYRVFWMRYYFLRSAVEEEERRRREVLRGATTSPTEEIAWDDEEDDEPSSTTPNQIRNNQAASASTTTLTQPAPKDTEPAGKNALLKPLSEPRRSHEDESKSIADSDASYDIVSGATSRATGSPKEEKREVSGSGKEDSDDDWE